LIDSGNSLLGSLWALMRYRHLPYLIQSETASNIHVSLLSTLRVFRNWKQGYTHRQVAVVERLL